MWTANFKTCRGKYRQMMQDREFMRQNSLAIAHSHQQNECLLESLFLPNGCVVQSLLPSSVLSWINASHQLNVVNVVNVPGGIQVTCRCPTCKENQRGSFLDFILRGKKDSHGGKLHRHNKSVRKRYTILKLFQISDRIKQMSKHIDIVGRQRSHYRSRNIQIWKQNELEL